MVPVLLSIPFAVFGMVFQLSFTSSPWDGRDWGRCCPLSAVC